MRPVLSPVPPRRKKPTHRCLCCSALYASVAGLILPIAFSVPVRGQTMKAPDIKQTPTLYVVPYAHLDTQWRWEFPQTISEYLLKTMRVNFDYFDKYLHYVFNWTGANRYRLMKECTSPLTTRACSSMPRRAAGFPPALLSRRVTLIFPAPKASSAKSFMAMSTSAATSARQVLNICFRTASAFPHRCRASSPPPESRASPRRS
jgi:hypothetical protein